MASCTSSSQNVPLISGLPGTRITLTVISRTTPAHRGPTPHEKPETSLGRIRDPSTKIPPQRIHVRITHPNRSVP